VIGELKAERGMRNERCKLERGVRNAEREKRASRRDAKACLLPGFDSQDAKMRFSDQ